MTSIEIVKMDSNHVPAGTTTSDDFVRRSCNGNFQFLSLGKEVEVIKDFTKSNWERPLHLKKGDKITLLSRGNAATASRWQIRRAA